MLLFRLKKCAAGPWEGMVVVTLADMSFERSYLPKTLPHPLESEGQNPICATKLIGELERVVHTFWDTRQRVLDMDRLTHWVVGLLHRLRPHIFGTDETLQSPVFSSSDDVDPDKPA